MGDKDQNYNDTKKEEDQINQALQSKPEICGIKAIPGNMYQSSIVATLCPSCNNIAPTNVESSWNIKSYICCYYCGPCWWCWQTVKGKDYTLKNGKHSCSSCNAEIHWYSSCE